MLIIIYFYPELTKMSYKKAIVVPIEQYTALKDNPSLYTRIQPLSKHLYNIDKEMKEVLESNMSPVEKMTKYSQLLKTYQNYDPNFQTTTPSLVQQQPIPSTPSDPSIPSTPTPSIPPVNPTQSPQLPTIGDRGELELPEAAGRRVKSNKKQKAMKHFINAMWDHIGDKFNEKGKLIFEEVEIQGSNLTDLLAQASSQTAKMGANGAKEFAQVLADSHMPISQIPNRFLKQQIQSLRKEMENRQVQSIKDSIPDQIDTDDFEDWEPDDF